MDERTAKARRSQTERGEGRDVQIERPKLNVERENASNVEAGRGKGLAGPVKRARTFLSILAAVSYSTCAGFHFWAADEAGMVVGSALPVSLQAPVALAALAFQPWVLLSDTVYRGNSVWVLIGMEVVSAGLLGAIFLLVQPIKGLHTMMVALAFLACPLLVWAALKNHESSREFNHRPSEA